jgi:hypothetical protein
MTLKLGSYNETHWWVSRDDDPDMPLALIVKYYDQPRPIFYPDSDVEFSMDELEQIVSWFKKETNSD